MRARSLVATLVSVLLLAAAPPLPAAEDDERRPAAVGEFFPQVLEDLYGATLQLTPGPIVVGTLDPLTYSGWVGMYLIPTLTTSTTNYGAAFDPKYSTTATDGRAISIYDRAGAGVALTTRYGLIVQNPDLSGGGTIATNYGIFVNAQTAGTTDYAIYTNQGQVRFGDSMTIASGATVQATDSFKFLNGAGCLGSSCATGPWNYLGVYINPVFTGATSSSQYGVWTDPNYNNSATSGYAIFADDIIPNGTALTNRYGVYVNDSQLSGTGSIANQFGLYVAAQTKGSSNKWAIYTAGTESSGFSGNLKHPSYVSQTSYWQLTKDGAADLRYLFVDEMHAKKFIADLEQALAGLQIITKSVAVLVSMTCPAYLGTATLTVEDLPGAADMQVFDTSDWVVLRTFSRAAQTLTIGDCVGTVSLPDTTGDGTQSWTFTRGTGPGGTGGSVAASTVMDPGGVVLDFGMSGAGYYEVNAVDGVDAEYSPYSQVVTWTTAPVSANKTVRARFGNLKGITAQANEFGIIAGTFASGDSGQYFRASNNAVELHGVNFTLYDGASKVFEIDRAAPSLALGDPIPTAVGTGKGIWMGGDGAGYYDFRVGDPAGGRLLWDGSASKLYAAGFEITSSYIMNTGGTVGMGSTAAWSFWAGGASTSTAKFRVADSGELWAWNAHLGWNPSTSTGWLATEDTIKDTSGVVGLSSAVTIGNDLRMWAGHTTPASASWRVYEDGSFTATNATISGSVTAGVGTIGGWTLASNYLTAGTAGTTVRLDSGGTNPAFSAGSATPASAPFRVTTAGALTATNATLTGSLSAASGNVNINSSGITLQSGGTYFFQWTDGSQMGSNSVLYIDGPTAGAGDMYLSAGTDYRWNGSAYYPYYTNAVDLGRSSNYWKDLYIAGIVFDPPNSTASDNPLVRYAGDGRIYEKTDVASLTCTSGNVVINPVFEAGMLTGGTCAANPPAPAPDEAAALRDEVADLRARVANLEALVERLLAAPNRPTEVGFSRPGLTLSNVPCVTVDPGGMSGSVVPCGGSK